MTNHDNPGPVPTSARGPQLTLAALETQLRWLQNDERAILRHIEELTKDRLSRHEQITTLEQQIYALKAKVQS